MAYFYANAGLIATKDHSTLKKVIDSLVALCEHVSLKINMAKTDAMTFVPGRI